MEQKYQNYLFSTDKSKIQMEQVEKLMKQTYWAAERPMKVMKKAIENSICYCIYDKNQALVGLARVITDYATTYYICDVIIDQSHRKFGLGKELLRVITNTEEIKNLRGILITKDAHGLYEKYGFLKSGDRFMEKPKK